MTDTALIDPAPDSIVAAEYVLGLLTPAEAVAARARIASDPGFAADVARWEDQLAPLLLGEDEPPAPSLWARIEQAVAPQPVQDNQPKSMWLWQAATGICASIAALFGVMLMNDAPTAPIAPPVTAAPLVAALGSETGKGAMTARFDRDRGMLQLTPVTMLTEDKAAELWVIPAGGKPYSLGLIDPVRPSEMAVSGDMMPMMVEGAMLTVTIESPDGAPHPAPNGPVVAEGPIVTL